MFLKTIRTVLSPIPFWQPFLTYTWGSHRKAIKKFLILWSISILPLVLAAFVSPVDKNLTGLDSFINFLSQIGSEFGGTHQFIYAVSFITPVLYLVIEQHDDLLSFLRSNKRKIDGNLKLAPDGYGWILWWSIIVFLFTIVGYAISTTEELRQQQTFIDFFLESTVYVVYVFALFCWYFSILDSIASPKHDFSESKKSDEDDFSRKLDDRIGRRSA